MGPGWDQEWYTWKQEYHAPDQESFTQNQEWFPQDQECYQVFSWLTISMVTIIHLSAAPNTSLDQNFKGRGGEGGGKNCYLGEIHHDKLYGHWTPQEHTSLVL